MRFVRSFSRKTQIPVRIDSFFSNCFLILVVLHQGSSLNLSFIILLKPAE